MRNILIWLLPPFAGAVIGYVTNALAIKMLFRPLAEIRFFGLRVPFTPGILPRERHKLADSIGRMVERELLTPGVLRERLAKPEVREKLRAAITAYTEKTLGQPLSRQNPESENTASFPAAELLSGFVNSDVFDSFLEELLKTWTAVTPSVSVEDEGSLGFWFKSRIRDIGAAFIPAARDLVKNGLAREFRNGSRREMSSFSRAINKIAEMYPGITLGEFLSLGSTKKEKLDSFLADKAAAAMDENIEAALLSVDVKTLVADRVNSMDMLRVEKLILDVMAGQLKWINIFGAILGALIGFVQILFYWLNNNLLA